MKLTVEAAFSEDDSENVGVGFEAIFIVELNEIIDDKFKTVKIALVEIVAVEFEKVGVEFAEVVAD